MGKPSFGNTSALSPADASKPGVSLPALKPALGQPAASRHAGVAQHAQPGHSAGLGGGALHRGPAGRVHLPAFAGGAGDADKAGERAGGHASSSTVLPGIKHGGGMGRPGIGGGGAGALSSLPERRPALGALGVPAQHRGNAGGNAGVPSWLQSGRGGGGGVPESFARQARYRPGDNLLSKADGMGAGGGGNRLAPLQGHRVRDGSLDGAQSGGSCVHLPAFGRRAQAAGF